jgi:hypothetical protein
MIIKKEPSGLLEINLNSPEGNAFNLLGVARRLCKATGKDFNLISKDMTSGDYDQLIEVFDLNFGDFVILYK